MSGGRTGDQDGNPYQCQGGETGERPAGDSHAGRRVSPKTGRKPDAVDGAQDHRRQDEHTVNQASYDERDDAVGRTEVNAVDGGTTDPKPGEFENNGKHRRCDKHAPTAAHDETG